MIILKITQLFKCSGFLLNVYIDIKIIVLSIKIYPNLNLCVFTRVLRMNNFMYTLLNADIHVIYRGVSVHTHVKCVIGHTVIRRV